MASPQSVIGGDLSEGDDRLGQLLATEQRLRAMVHQARQDAACRVAASRAESERRIAAAREEAARTDTERAEADRVAQAQALAEVEIAHKASLESLARLSGERIDALARWTIAQVLAETGAPL